MGTRSAKGRRRRQQWEVVLAAGVGVCAVMALALAGITRDAGARNPASVQPMGVEEASSTPAETPAFPHTLRRNSTFFEALKGLGVHPQDIFGLTHAAQGLRNLSRLPAGVTFALTHELPPVPAFAGVKIRFSPVEHLEVFRAAGGQWEARLAHERVNTRLVTYTGRVASSLWESAVEARMDPELIAGLTEIFAWQVDFAREVRMDDRWRLTVEQKLLDDGTVVGWGAILAAEYENDGTVYTAALHRKGGKDEGYFSPEGTSLRRMFLRSPIAFGRISSRFMRSRFHPILKTRRPHMGVDYAAPVGTPIRAVGDGVVTEAGWKGDAGRTLRLRHNSVYQTAYKHLSGFAPGVGAGTRVRQGQVVGYVGTTGLSSGPHLHFEFYQSGRFVDPMGKKFPTANPVPRAELAEFQGMADTFLSTLPPWFYPGVTAPGPVYVVAQLKIPGAPESATSAD
ncbi:MAG: M23 family metallopeptidase [Bdellovibrionales bacterium]|nr:M23 family metallopeptidase [Bdellovibrionales bacterium]